MDTKLTDRELAESVISKIINADISTAIEGLMNVFANQRAAVARDTEAKYGGTVEEVRALVEAGKKAVDGCAACKQEETNPECDKCVIPSIHTALAPWGVK